MIRVALGALAYLAASGALRIAGGEYGVAWLLAATAWAIHRRRRSRLAWWLALGVTAAAITDLHAVRQTITYLTGVPT